jgi:hypothetical protein
MDAARLYRTEIQFMRGVVFATSRSIAFDSQTSFRPMIHQCYFDSRQRNRLFQHAPYAPFGLEPSINPTLLEGCDELADPAVRLELVEYGAMLHHWRNPGRDSDQWIGFTSYRQLDKIPFVFTSADELTAHLEASDLVSWFVADVSAVRLGWVRGVAAQAELASPRLHSFTIDVLKAFDIVPPKSYYDGVDIVFANYWAMSRSRFNQFMEWSWPKIQHALAMPHPYKTHSHQLNSRDDKGKCVGYLMERLFIVWTKIEQLTISRVGALQHF